MDVQLPDGTLLKGVPDGTTKADLVTKLQANGKAVPAEWLEAKPADKRGPVGKAADAVGGFLQGVGDAGATLASGALAAPVSGALGVGQAVTNLGRRAVGLPVTTTAADAQEDAEKALTYQPRTQGGQEYVHAITTPLRVLAEGADKAGDATTRGLTAVGAPLPIAAGAGAAVNTGIQMLPGMVEPAVRAGKSYLAPRPGVEPPPAAPPPGGPQAPLTTTSAPRGTMTPVEPDPRPLPGAGAPGTPGAIPPQRPAISPEETRARDYAANRLGVDWDSLSAKFKQTLTSIATDAKRLDSLPVDAVKRQAQLQSLRVPVTTTRGRLLRDETATREEANVSATSAGKPIRDIDTEANRALRANVEGLRTQVGGVGKTRATAADPGQGARAEVVGRQVQEQALGEKEKASKANYNRLYKIARNTDPDATASAAPIQEVAQKNPAIQHLNWVPAWFKKAAAAEGVDAIDQVKLKDLQDLRTQAVGIARAGGTDGFHAGQVVEAIDQVMETAPDSAKAWKAAQKAYREHQTEFGDTAAIKRLTDTKSTGQDRATALEDTWKKSVQTASLEDIDKLKRSLLSGGNAETRLAGKKALRELRQETVQQFLDHVTRKTGTNEAGETEITAVQMVEAKKFVGGDARLRRILGERAVNELDRIIEAAKIAKTEPTKGGRAPGSSTIQNLMVMLDKFSGVPGVSTGVDIAVGAAKKVSELKSIGAGGRAARRAVQQPTDAAEASTKARIRRAQLAEKARKAGRAIKFSGENALRRGGMTLRDDTDMGK